MYKLPRISNDLRDVLDELVDSNDGNAIIELSGLQESLMGLEPKGFFAKNKHDKEYTVGSIVYKLWKDAVTSGGNVSDGDFREAVINSKDSLIRDSYTKVMNKEFISTVTEWVTKELVGYYIENSNIFDREFVDKLYMSKEQDVDLVLVDETYEYYQAHY